MYLTDYVDAVDSEKKRLLRALYDFGQGKVVYFMKNYSLLG